MSEPVRPPSIPDLCSAFLEAADTAGIGVLIVRLHPRLENIFVSERAAQILGRTVASALAMSPMEGIAPHQQSNMADRLVARERGVPLPPFFETVLRRPDGTEIPIELGRSYVTVEGTPSSIVFVRDLSERKTAEERLGRSERRLRRLIESAPDGIVISRGRAIIYANPAAARLLGVEDADGLVGRSFAEFLHPDDFREMGERIGMLAPGSPPLGPHEYRARALDGRAVVVEVTSILFEDRDGPCVVGFARDVTEARRLQAQLMRADRLAALGTMAAGVAHEINNPLAFMLLGLDSIDRRLDSAPEPPLDIDLMRSTLADMRHGVDRIAAIVRQLRVFSRVEEPTRRAVSNLREVVEASARMAAHEIRQHGVLHVELPEDLPAVRGDSTQLEQVFLNLLINAAHALEASQGAGRVVVSAETVPDDFVEVRVKDDGVGIGDSDMAHIFDPFFTTKPVGSGTGLGLSICHSIVNGLGGEIFVETDGSPGTTFVVRLPALSRVLRASTPPRALRRRSSSRSLSLLVVDDEVAFLRAMERLLGPDHDVVTVSDPARAWERMTTGEPDLIFLDVMMPVVSGMEIYQRAARERPELADRIVFVSGGSSRPVVRRFLARVKRPILTKPFDAARVSALLTRLVP